MKIPKRLKIDRACFYELMPDATQGDLDFHELLFRHHYKGIFKCRLGLAFFFELPDAQQRDVFLNLMEGMCPGKGILTKRYTIYPS